MDNENLLLDIKDLRIAFDMEEGTIVPVDWISFKLHQGKTLCLVGESGCGKSLTSLSIMGLIPFPPGRIAGGTIAMNGNNLLARTEKEMESIRGNEIAMALSCKPKLIIADEPTTALDVTIQAQILDLLRKLREETHMALLLITNNLGVVANVAVMYAGKIVEMTTVRSLFNNPKHPYTIGLMNSIPRPGKKDKLVPIEGTVPDPANFPDGCRFCTRCERIMARCETEEPPLKDVDDGHLTACWLYEVR